MIDRTMTSDDRRELVDGVTRAFRDGDFGPITLRARLRELGMGDDEIASIRDKYVDECARNMRA